MKIRPLKNKSGSMSTALQLIARRPVSRHVVIAPSVKFLKSAGVKNPQKLLGAPK